MIARIRHMIDCWRYRRALAARNAREDALLERRLLPYLALGQEEDPWTIEDQRALDLDLDAWGRL